MAKVGFKPTQVHASHCGRAGSCAVTHLVGYGSPLFEHTSHPPLHSCSKNCAQKAGRLALGVGVGPSFSWVGFGLLSRGEGWPFLLGVGPSGRGWPVPDPKEGKARPSQKGENGKARGPAKRKGRGGPILKGRARPDPRGKEG